MGEVAGIGSALGIAAIGICLGIITGPFKEILSGAVAITLGGVIAMNFDSILGGTVQGQNRCQICGAKTESRMHHKEKTTPWGVFRHLDNNGVNLVATLFGAIIAVVIFLALGGIP